jgi:hypothetical protein
VRPQPTRRTNHQTGTTRPECLCLQDPTGCLRHQPHHPHFPEPPTPRQKTVLTRTAVAGTRTSQYSTTEQPTGDIRSGLALDKVSLDKMLLRKEVIQPHLPVRLPCYDFVPIASPTFDHSLPQGVGPWASGVADFRDVTGGVYKARERIHRSNADLRLLATPTSCSRVADCNPN